MEAVIDFNGSDGIPYACGRIVVGGAGAVFEGDRAGLTDQLIGGRFCAISNAVVVCIDESADDSIAIGIDVECFFPSTGGGFITGDKPAAFGDDTV